MGPKKNHQIQTQLLDDPLPKKYHIKIQSNISKKCLLCVHENFEIVNYPRPEELLNKISKLISKCRCAKKFLLCNDKNNH